MIREHIPPRLMRRLKHLYYNHIRGYALKSYSQEGEDMVLRRFFENRDRGFYVDVGAHHPKRFSNTYFFYRQGWRGINIEPNPEGHALLQACRKNDINVQSAVSDSEGTLEYHMFQEPALNTLDRQLAEQHAAASPLTGVINIQVRRLEAILDEQLPQGTTIDFMNIDVEGHDMQVLQSNNWEKYRPRLVIAEVLGKNIGQIQDSGIARFMHSVGYELFAKTVNSVFFRDAAGNA